MSLKGRLMSGHALEYDIERFEILIKETSQLTT